MGRHRKLCIAAIVVLALVCIGALVYVLSSGQKRNTWDEINFAYGLDAKEVELSSQEQRDVDELIWNYDFTELSQAELEQQEVLYGGSVISVEFVKDGTSHRWIFSANSISHRVYEQDMEQEVHYYAGDRKIQRELEKFVNW